MATKITPLHDRLVVRRDPEQALTEGGIYIPDTAREKSTVGTVVAVGKGRVDEHGKVTPLDVKEGDRILFGKYAGSEAKRYAFESDGEELLILREEEVLGVLSGSAETGGLKGMKQVAAKR